MLPFIGNYWEFCAGVLFAAGTAMVSTTAPILLMKAFIGGVPYLLRTGLGKRWMGPKDHNLPQALVEELASSMEVSPEEWTAGVYTLEHRKTGITIWIAHGAGQLHLHRPEEIYPSLPQRAQLWEAYLKHIPQTNMKASYKVLSLLRDGYRLKK